MNLGNAADSAYVVLWHLTLFGQMSNITKLISSVLTILLVEYVMPPITKNARVAKKAKPA